MAGKAQLTIQVDQSLHILKMLGETEDCYHTHYVRLAQAPAVATAFSPSQRQILAGRHNARTIGNLHCDLAKDDPEVGETRKHTVRPVSPESHSTSQV